MLQVPVTEETLRAALLEGRDVVLDMALHTLQGT
jgi:hypothetical protein